jgi:hypothetical protein
MATYSKGVLGFISSVSGGREHGLIQSLTVDGAGETAEAPDQDGEVKAHEDFNAAADVSMEVILNTATTLPVWGQVMTVTGSLHSDGGYACRGASVNQANKDYKKCTIKGHRYLHNSLPVATDSTTT